MFGLFSSSKSKTLATDADTFLTNIHTGLTTLESSFQLMVNDQIAKCKQCLDLDADLAENPFIRLGKSILEYQSCLMSFEDQSFISTSQCLTHLETATNLNLTTCQQLIKLEKCTEKIKKLLEVKLALELILADSLLMSASLSFLSQSISEFPKAAYKLKRSYDLFSAIYKAKVSDNKSNSTLTLDNFDNVPPLSQHTNNHIDDFTISGTGFGLGLFKLMLSSLPKRAKSFLTAVGLTLSERDEAICHLRFAITFKSLHGPLACLLLLSFYSGWVSFLAHRPCSDTKEFQEASQVIPVIRTAYPDGKVWLLLDAKLVKLKGDLTKTSELLNLAMNREYDNWPELNALILYELGWCQLLEGKFDLAANSFHTLGNSTNWSKAFYTYLEGVCHIYMDDMTTGRSLLNSVPDLIKKKFGGRTIPVELFVKSRSQHYLAKLHPDTPEQPARVLPVLELIYFFNGFHFMPNELLSEHYASLTAIPINTPQFDQASKNLTHLLTGTVLRELRRDDEASHHLKLSLADAVARYNSMHSTTSAYAHFELAVLNMSLEEAANAHLDTIRKFQSATDLEERLQFRLQWLTETGMGITPVLT